MFGDDGMGRGTNNQQWSQEQIATTLFVFVSLTLLFEL